MICPYLKKTVIKKWFSNYEDKEITEITQEFRECPGVSCPFAKLVTLPNVDGTSYKHFNCLKAIADMKGAK